jgi:hypothetical protein
MSKDASASFLMTASTNSFQWNRPAENNKGTVAFKPSQQLEFRTDEGSPGRRNLSGKTPGTKAPRATFDYVERHTGRGTPPGGAAIGCAPLVASSLRKTR